MKVVAFDTEARGLDWWDPEHQAFLGTWADEHGEYHADLSVPEERERFILALLDADVLIAHNLPYDLHQVRETLGVDLLEDGESRFVDTAMLSRVLHPSGQQRVRHGLKDLAQIYLRADAAEAEEAIAQAAKDIGLRTLKRDGAYYEVWRAYPEMMEKYARLDARYTYDLHEQFAPQLNGQQQVFDLEMQVMPILIRAEARGVKVDQAKVQELKAEYIGQMTDAQLAIGDAFGLEVDTPEFDAVEGKDLAERLIKQGVPLHRKTKTGTLSTDAYALAQFEDEHPVVGQLQEYRRLRKFLSTYIGALDGRDVVHPSFWQLGAWTGRMSCSRPNLQNWPKRAGKEVRATLVPRPGHAFVVCDYESIEARLLAYYLGDEGYRELVEHRDPHAWMAAQIHGGEVSDYVKGSAGEVKRAEAKNVTFAITYGSGAPRIRDMLRGMGSDFGMTSEELRLAGLQYAGKLNPGDPIFGTEQEGRDHAQLEVARSLISKVKSSLPRWWDLQRRIRHKVETLGHVNTIYGRKQLVSKEKAYVGLNALIQGSAADIFKLGLVSVAEAVSELGAVPLLFVHDEIVVECPSEHAKECLARMDAAMTQPGRDLGLKPSLSVEGSITETSYADA